MYFLNYIKISFIGKELGIDIMANTLLVSIKLSDKYKFPYNRLTEGFPVKKIKSFILLILYIIILNLMGFIPHKNSFFFEKFGQKSK